MALCAGPVSGVSMVLYVKVGTSTLGKTRCQCIDHRLRAAFHLAERLQRRMDDDGRIPQVQLAQSQQQVPVAHCHFSRTIPGYA